MVRVVPEVDPSVVKVTVYSVLGLAWTMLTETTRLPPAEVTVAVPLPTMYPGETDGRGTGDSLISVVVTGGAVVVVVAVGGTVDVVMVAVGPTDAVEVAVTLGPMVPVKVMLGPTVAVLVTVGPIEVDELVAEDDVSVMVTVGEECELTRSMLMHPAGTVPR